MKYRTKPFEIEAIQYDGTNADEIYDWSNGNIRQGREIQVYDYLHDTWITFYIGNYIIKGMNGEFYPCVPDVFEAKYELIQKADLSGPFPGGN